MQAQNNERDVDGMYFVDRLRRLAREMRREGFGLWGDATDRLATEMRMAVQREQPTVTRRDRRIA